MKPDKDMPADSTCTTCTFSEDFSNYWTAVLFFKARNGTYKRVSQRPNAGFEGAVGGMTVYYMQDGLADYEQKDKVTAFKQVRKSPCFVLLLAAGGLTKAIRDSACLSVIRYSAPRTSQKPTANLPTPAFKT